MRAVLLIIFMTLSVTTLSANTKNSAAIEDIFIFKAKGNKDKDVFNTFSISNKFGYCFLIFPGHVDSTKGLIINAYGKPIRTIDTFKPLLGYDLSVAVTNNFEGCLNVDLMSTQPVVGQKTFIAGYRPKSNFPELGEALKGYPIQYGNRTRDLYSTLLAQEGLSGAPLFSLDINKNVQVHSVIIGKGNKSCLNTTGEDCISAVTNAEPLSEEVIKIINNSIETFKPKEISSFKYKNYRIVTKDQLVRWLKLWTEENNLFEVSFNENEIKGGFYILGDVEGGTSFKSKSIVIGSPIITINGIQPQSIKQIQQLLNKKENAIYFENGKFTNI